MKLEIFRSAVQGEKEISPEVPYRLSGYDFINTMFEKMDLEFKSFYLLTRGSREISVEINEESNTITFVTGLNSVTLKFETETESGEINGISELIVHDKEALKVELIDKDHVALNRKDRKILFKDSEKNECSFTSSSLPVLLDRILFYM